MAAAAPLGRLAATLNTAAAALSSLRKSWALVGGLAVSARTEPRFTRDVDMAVVVKDDEEAESLVNTLLGRGCRLIASLEQEATGRLATVRLVFPGEEESGVVVDLLFASSGIEPEVVAAGETLEVLPGHEWPVARLGHLLALKVLSQNEQRPQDRVDIVALIAQADDEAVDLARAAVRLIEARGYGRGRDVAAELEGVLEPRRS